MNQDSGERRATQSNPDGFFASPSVRPSTYTVSVVAAGFANFSQKDVIVHPAEQLAVKDITLRVGDTSTSVEVTAATNPVPTDTEAKGSLITSQQIQNLAIEGRNTVELRSCPEPSI